MFSRLREPFGKAGLTVAIVAMVTALVGGAYAADQATDSAKKRNAKAKKNKKKAKGVTVSQVRKISKQEAQKFANSNPGAAGLPGAPGLPGAAGQKGDTGSQGAKGDTGDQGPQGIQGAQGPEGPEGSPWTAGGTLPSGETLTGTWAMAGVTGDFLFAPISFPIPLEEAVEAGNRHVMATGAPPTAECPGVFLDPQAAPGHLCAYISVANNLAPAFGASLLVAGDWLAASATGTPAFAQGSWAVTAP